MRTSITENGAGRENRYLTFAYDKLYRLTSETDSQRNGGAAVVYTYDDFGNRLTRTYNFNYPLFNLKSNYDLWLKTEKRQKCGRNVAFSPRIGHFGRESATVDKKEREPEFELRFPEFRQKNGRDREI